MTIKSYELFVCAELLLFQRYFILPRNPYLIMSCGYDQVNHRQQIRLPPGPVNVGVLKGYIVLSSSLGVAVYNTTMSMRTGPREVILEPHSTIAAAFGQEVIQICTYSLMCIYYCQLLSVMLSIGADVFDTKDPNP